jgi:hypothetical protein
MEFDDKRKHFQTFPLHFSFIVCDCSFDYHHHRRRRRHRCRRSRLLITARILNENNIFETENFSWKKKIYISL